MDSRADLYSIGITLVRLATGSLPLDNRRRPRRTDPDSAPEWDAFLLKGTARDKQDRFASAEEMLRALEGLWRHWETSKPSVCPDSAPTAERTGKKTPFLFLRARPLKTPLREARSLFKVDRLWRPRRFSSLNLRETGDGTVLDDAHGLRWEQNGSAVPVDLAAGRGIRPRP